MSSKDLFRNPQLRRGPYIHTVCTWPVSRLTREVLPARPLPTSISFERSSARLPAGSGEKQEERSATAQNYTINNKSVVSERIVSYRSPAARGKKLPGSRPAPGSATADPCRPSGPADPPRNSIDDLRMNSREYLRNPHAAEALLMQCRFTSASCPSEFARARAVEPSSATIDASAPATKTLSKVSLSVYRET